MSKSNLWLPLIILFGPPGSGKGTQANLICKELDLFSLSIGNSVRAFVNQNSSPDSPEAERVSRLKRKLESGELQDFEDVKYIVEKEIKTSILEHKNILIEGLPRTTEQAEWLAEFFRESNVECLFYHFVLPQEVVLERLSHRFYAPGDETPYSSYEEALGHCNGAETPIQRKDDQDVNIIKHRYEKQYESVQGSILSTVSECDNVKIIDVDATPEAEVIFEFLKKDILLYSKEFSTR